MAQRSVTVARHDGEASDAVLVGLARAGDRAAYEALVRRYTRVAYMVALGVVREPADAEDVCQDAFVRALERLDDCEPARFGAWLLRIVRNRAHSVRRYLGVRNAASLEVAVVASDTAGPERDAARSRLRSDLLSALATLKEVQRQVVLLHDLEGWKHREIGELLDLPEGTVRAHLFHARRALRDHSALRRAREGSSHGT
jgi:RNA polymerase sigma-70 factor, ECF subfamily